MVSSPRHLAADIAIIGFGGAGATAAIEAARRGASVVIVERAAKGMEGGNTRISAQGFINPRDPGAMTSYLTALSHDIPIKPDRLRIWAEEACYNAAWLESFGTATERLPAEHTHAEYPELAGAETIVKMRVRADTGRDLWSSLKSQVERLGVQVEFGWRATKLRTDVTGRVTDIICLDRSGARLTITGRHGVILAPGGYGASPQYLARFAPQTGWAASAGCPHNTGDGLAMAAAVGARWSGLTATSGPYLAFLPPGYHATVPLEPLMHYAEADGKFAVVDWAGRQIMNKKVVTRHGWVPAGGTWKKIALPERTYFICGANLARHSTLVKGPAGAGWCRAVEGLRWSQGNADEHKRGWLRQFTDPNALAAYISGRPTTVSSHVGSWDELWSSAHRDLPKTGTGTERPHGPPFFALRLVRSVLNTHGGPERDEYCRVISKNGMAIEGLFGAGELGSIFPGLYQGSGNIADCLVSGRIAARSALA